MTPIQYLADKTVPILGMAERLNQSDEFSEDFDPGRIDPHLVCLLQPNSEISETYSRLRLSLENNRRSKQCFVLGVTSAGKHEGKTLTAVNLAGALAGGSDTRVLLIDLDLRDSCLRVSDYLNLDRANTTGVTDWLDVASATQHEPQVRHLPAFNLHVLPAGSVAESAYELLKSKRLATFIEAARQHFDFIVIDTPRILSLPDTELISRLVDSYVLVVRANKTNRKDLEEALNLMAPEKVAGIVFNDTGSS